MLIDTQYVPVERMLYE